MKQQHYVMVHLIHRSVLSGVNYRLFFFPFLLFCLSYKWINNYRPLNFLAFTSADIILNTPFCCILLFGLTFKLVQQPILDSLDQPFIRPHQGIWSTCFWSLCNFSSLFFFSRRAGMGGCSELVGKHFGAKKEE